MDQNVGDRLREVRVKRGLSQRALAERAGVTNGLISIIEQNRSSPSVASLKRILDAVPMTFSEFFSEEYPRDEKVFYRFGELREINPARVFSLSPDFANLVSLRQIGDASRHALQLLHETYEPGADTGKELYTHVGEEAGIVITGHIELTVGRQTERLGPGDAYIFDSKRPHRFRNSDTTVCIIVSACTPASF